MLEKDIERISISQEEVQVRYKELDKELAEIYRDINPLMMGTLKGAVPFMVGIVRSIDTYLELDFMDASNCGNATASSGEIKIVKDLDTNAEGRDLLIIEDIIDNGRTLVYLVGLLKYREAKSAKIVTLLDKPEGRVINIEIDHVGSSVPNKFVAGHGLDYAEAYRNLPCIGVLEPTVYQSD